MGKYIYTSIPNEYPSGSGGGVTPEQVQQIVTEMLKSMQNYIKLGEGLAWLDETSNTIITTNKVNGIDGAITLNPDDFVKDGDTIKLNTKYATKEDLSLKANTDYMLQKFSDVDYELEGRVTVEQMDAQINIAKMYADQLAKTKQDVIDWNNLEAPVIITGGNEPTNRKPLEVTSEGELLSYGEKVAVETGA